MASLLAYNEKGQWAKDVAPVFILHRPHRPHFPLSIIDPALAAFEENVRSLVPSASDVDFAATLIAGMTPVYTLEEHRRKLLTEMFSNFLQADFNPRTIEVESGHNFTTDISYVVSCPTQASKLLACLAVNVEVKREIGGTSADPCMENIAYYSQFWSQQSCAVLREVCHCPTLLIVVAGPFIFAAGAIFTEYGIIASPLSPFLPLLFNPHSEIIVDVARFVGALRIAVASLREYYTTLVRGINQAPHLPRGPTTFPYQKEYTLFGEQEAAKGTFVYTKSAVPPNSEDLKLVFFGAETSPRQGASLVIKFCRRYGSAAHRAASAAGLAPCLRGLDMLGTGWIMVVMDPLLPSFISLAQFKTSLAKTSGAKRASGLEQLQVLRKKATRAMLTMHTQKFVHGDLRDANIFVDASSLDVMLIDFDWSDSSENSPHYPLFLNLEAFQGTDITHGVEMTFERDAACLSKAFELE